MAASLSAASERSHFIKTSFLDLLSVTAQHSESFVRKVCCLGSGGVTWLCLAGTLPAVWGTMNLTSLNVGINQLTGESTQDSLRSLIWHRWCMHGFEKHTMCVSTQNICKLRKCSPMRDCLHGCCRHHSWQLGSEWVLAGNDKCGHVHQFPHRHPSLCVSDLCHEPLLCFDA